LVVTSKHTGNISIGCEQRLQLSHGLETRYMD